MGDPRRESLPGGQLPGLQAGRVLQEIETPTLAGQGMIMLGDPAPPGSYMLVCPPVCVSLYWANMVSATARQATDFLIAIAEPVCRPEYIHEYLITPHSLYAAVSVGLDTRTMLQVLATLSKVPLHKDVDAFIRECTENYGKVRDPPGFCHLQL